MSEKKVVEKIKTYILCSITFFLNCTVCEIMWKNNVERGRPHMTIRRMRITCWIPRATHTHTHTEYVIVLHSHCNSGCTNAPQCFLTLHWLPCYFQAPIIHSWSHCALDQYTENCECLLSRYPSKITAVDDKRSTSRSGRFTPGQELRYTPSRRLGGPETRSGRFGEEINRSLDLPIRLHIECGFKNVILRYSPSQFTFRLQRKQQIVVVERWGSESKLVTGGLRYSGAVNIVRTQSVILILSFHLHDLHLSNLPLSVYAVLVP
jgi:hypothetical protein